MMSLWFPLHSVDVVLEKLLVLLRANNTLASRPTKGWKPVTSRLDSVMLHIKYQIVIIWFSKESGFGVRKYTQVKELSPHLLYRLKRKAMYNYSFSVLFFFFLLVYILPMIGIWMTSVTKYTFDSFDKYHKHTIDWITKVNSFCWSPAYLHHLLASCESGRPQVCCFPTKLEVWPSASFCRSSIVWTSIWFWSARSFK